MKNTICTTNNEKEEEKEFILTKVVIPATGLRKQELLNIKHVNISIDCFYLSSNKSQRNHLVRHTIILSNTLQLEIKKHQLALYQNEYIFDKTCQNRTNIKRCFNKYFCKNEYIDVI